MVEFFQPVAGCYRLRNLMALHTFGLNELNITLTIIHEKGFLLGFSNSTFRGFLEDG